MSKQESHMSLKENAAAFLKRQGFFIVLGLCVVCIGIAVLIAIPKGGGEQAAPTPMEQEVGQSNDQKLQEVIPATPAPQTTPSNVAAAAMAEETPAPTSTPKAEKPKSSSKDAPPVDGKIIWGFAIDTLLYSKTLEMWTTHEGIDISAKQGTEVRAIRGGKIADIYLDNALGVTVVIEHDGGLRSLYANLSDPPRIEKGQAVETGAIIGEVGNTAVSECDLESHLHFSMYKDGKAVDPTKYVLIKKK